MSRRMPKFLTTITKILQTGTLSNRILFLIVYEAGKSKFRASAVLLIANSTEEERDLPYFTIIIYLSP